MSENAWQSIANAPFDRDLELAVIESGEVYSLIVPGRRIPSGWINASTGRRVEVNPTHWRDWRGKDVAE